MTQLKSKMSRVFKAIAEPKRLRIIEMLADGEMSASQILKEFEVTQPTLSHDMRLLIDAELVEDRRMGKTVIYRLNRETLQGMIDMLSGVISKADAE